MEQIILTEKMEILKAVFDLNLKFAVITSVTRDDDPANLALHFREISQSLRHMNIGVELLIPDFKADRENLKIIGDGQPDVIAHNLETIERLSQKIRPQASYKKSLEVLQYYRGQYPKMLLKTGFMVGLGETLPEIMQLMKDIFNAGADILTVGQYLQPGKTQVQVEKFYTEQEFENLKNMAHEMGIKNVQSGYFTRSSYNAAAYATRINPGETR